jgi:hypothetical protein
MNSFVFTSQNVFTQYCLKRKCRASNNSFGKKKKMENLLLQSSTSIEELLFWLFLPWPEVFPYDFEANKQVRILTHILFQFLGSYLVVKAKTGTSVKKLIKGFWYSIICSYSSPYTKMVFTIKYINGVIKSACFRYLRLSYEK